MVEWLKKPWPYWVGGILLGIFNVTLLAITGTVWHINTGFLTWGMGILDFIGIKVYDWRFFKIFNYTYNDTILNIGVITGSLIATLLSSQFKLKRLKDKKQTILALVGGIIMGYGARLTSGCNIGSFFGGIPSFSLHAWVYWIFVVLGAVVGTKILSKLI